MKGKTVVKGAGIIAVGALILGLSLGDFPGLGGGGEGEGETRVDLGETQPTSVERLDRSAEKVETSDSKPSETEPVEVDGALHIVVEPDGYSLKRMRADEVEYRPMPLEELIALARRTPSSGGKVRVHITMRENATGGAQQALVQKLVDAGIDQGAIDGKVDDVRLEPSS